MSRYMMLPTLLLAVAVATQPALVHAQDYQDYVARWSPASAPLCRVFTSADAWQRTLRPAAVMGAHRPFAPPAQFWREHAVVFVARTIYAGSADDALSIRRIERTNEVMTVDYSFAPTPRASSTMNWWSAAAVEKPLPARVIFRENGRTVCQA